MDFYLSRGKSVRKIAEYGEWIILVLVGAVFDSPRLPDSIYIFISGIILMVAGYWIHNLSHQAHRQAHDSKEAIRAIVTTGIYSKIRHPGYLGYLLGYLGVFLAIGSYPMLIVILAYTLSFIHSIISEENFLREKFGNKYETYIKQVPWRLVPYLF